MRDERRLDDYLDALAHDPGAPPPDGLDDGLAETARRVSAAAQVPPLDSVTRAALWQTVLAGSAAPDSLPTAADPAPISRPAAGRPPRGVTSHNGSRGEPMTLSVARTTAVLTLPVRRAGGRSFALPLIAALIGVLLFAALLWMGGPDRQPAASPLLQTTPSPTPTSPAFLPTYPPPQSEFYGPLATPGGQVTELVAGHDRVLEGTLTAEQPLAVYHLAEGQTGLLLLRLEVPDERRIFLGLSDQLMTSQTFTSLIVGRIGLIRASDPWYVYVGSPEPITEPVAYQLSVRIFATAETQAPQIAYGETFEGHFDGVHLPMVRFQGIEGDVIHVAVDTRNTVDSALMLLPFRGEVLDDDSGPGFDPELLDLKLYQTGSYLLAVVPKETSAVGDFQLTLERTGQQPMPTAPVIPDTSAALRQAAQLTLGLPRRAALPPEGYASYRFRVEEHTLYAVQVASDDPAGLPDMQYTFRVTAFNQRGGTGNVASLTTALDLLDVYSVSDVLLTVIGAPDQAYTLTVTPLEAVDLAAGETAEGTLSEALPLAVYALHLRADEAVTLAASGQDGFDTRLQLFDWRWQALTEDSDSGAGRDPEINGYARSEDSALYVLVLPEDPAAPNGTFTLRLDPVS